MVRFGVGSSAAPYKRRYREAVDSSSTTTTFRPAAAPWYREVFPVAISEWNGLVLQSSIPAFPEYIGSRGGMSAPNALRCIPTVSTFDTATGPTATIAPPTITIGVTN